MALGLAGAASPIPPTTAYLMVGERCARDCAFCAQARSSAAGADMLSRVSWPRFELGRVLEALQQHQDRFRRVCIQATSGPRVMGKVLQALRTLVESQSLPVDVSALPPGVSAADEIVAAGADHIGFGLDAATETVFRRTKGPGWETYRHLIEHVSQAHPGRAAIHLIAGLGETEEEMIGSIGEHTLAGAVVGLFAFCPVPGTAMGQNRPPSPASYRRMQVARFLLAVEPAAADGFRFDSEGTLIGLGPEVDAAALLDGEAFRTSGCPGCNRPFYNERPGGPMYNFPRPLTEEEAVLALRETGLPELVSAAGRSPYA